MSLKFSQGGVTVLEKMENDHQARVKLTNAQVNIWKTGTILRFNKKKVEDEELLRMKRQRESKTCSKAIVTNIF